MGVTDTTKKDVTLKLGSLKGNVWQAMTPKEKLPYLESVLAAWIGVGPKGFEAMVGEGAADVKGVTGKEREMVKSEEAMLCAVFPGYIQGLIAAYKVLAGTEDGAELKNIPKRVVGNQVVATVSPLLQQEKEGPTGDFRGELWFQEGVQSELVQPFDLANLQDGEDGVLCILGAGNYSVLTFTDILHGLFVRNRAVFCKLHPLRAYLQGFMEVVLAKFYEDGFLASEADVSVERTKAIVYSDLVTSVHMTGGKPTHDVIVWGPPDQQEANKAKKSPILKNASMTSELGAATPYIMTPGEYTKEELEHQAKVLVGGKWCNGSASCNAPQNIVVGKNWKQRDDFIAAVESAWANTPPVATYYPGAAERWQGFADHYGKEKTKVVHRDEKKETDPTHLPLLMVFIDVDLSTPEGRAKARKEYAFMNEAFTPVVVIVTLENSDFMPKATELANEYMFGSLSCSLAVPSSAESSPEVEKTIAELKYGAIATNAWSGSCYTQWPLCWGAVHGEKLEAIESGIGSVCNSMLFAKVEKSVLRTPCVHPMHFDFSKTVEEVTGFNRYLTRALLGMDPNAE